VVREAISREKSAEILDIFAGGDNRGFDVIGAEGLAETDGGEKAITETFSAHGIGGVATLAPELRCGFGGAAVADRAVGSLVGLAQIAEVAGASTLFVDGGLGDSTGEIDDLERHTGGRGAWVGAQFDGASGASAEGGFFQVGA
jgi:hypothetical protein